MEHTSVHIGRLGEDLAEAYLRLRGYGMIERNLRHRRYEVDMIATDQECLVFVEVKSRFNISRGEGFDHVTPAKQRRISQVAASYVHRNKWGDAPIRFDIISITFRSENRNIYHIQHFKNAFTPF